MIVINGVALADATIVAEAQARIVEGLSNPIVPFDLEIGAHVLARLVQARVTAYSTVKGNVPEDYVGWVLQLTGFSRIIYAQTLAGRVWMLVQGDPNVFGADGEVQG